MPSSNCFALFLLTVSVQTCTSILSIYICCVYIEYIYTKIQKNRLNNLCVIGLTFPTENHRSRCTKQQQTTYKTNVAFLYFEFLHRILMIHKLRALTLIIQYSLLVDDWTCQSNFRKCSSFTKSVLCSTNKMLEMAIKKHQKKKKIKQLFGFAEAMGISHSITMTKTFKYS